MSPSALRKMWWVVTFKEAEKLLGPAMEVRSPPRRQQHEDLVRCVWHCLHHSDSRPTGDVKCAFLQGDLEQKPEDNKGETDFKYASTEPVTDTFLRPSARTCGAAVVSGIVNAFVPESRVWASKRAWQTVPSSFNGFAITGKWRDLDGAVLVGIS